MSAEGERHRQRAGHQLDDEEAHDAGAPGRARPASRRVIVDEAGAVEQQAQPARRPDACAPPRGTVNADHTSSSPIPTPRPTTTPISAAPLSSCVHVDAGLLEPRLPRRKPGAPHQSSPPRRWKTGSSSIASPSVATRAPRRSPRTRRVPCRSMPRWTTRSTELATVGHHEPRRDVLPRQQRERAHLDQGLPGAVGVHRRHAGQSGVQREEQVEALLGAHLADDDPGRAASAGSP